MNYAQYLEKGQTIESTESLIEKVINSQGQDENALQELVNRAQSQDSKAIEFLQMLQQQSGVSKFQTPSGPIVKKDQQDPNMPAAAETGTVDGRKYVYMPYPGEGPGAPVKRFEYQGTDGNIYGMNVTYGVEGLPNDTAYIMNGLRYTDPEGQQVIRNRQQAVTSNKCGGRVKKKALGSKLLKAKKASCGCQLKKVGGRLIEVDGCTGLPIHRTGAAIKKFEKPAGVLEKGDFGYTYNGQSYTRGTGGTWYTSATPKDLNSYTKIFDANLIKELNSAYNKAGFDYSTEEKMHQNKNYYLDKNGRNTWYRWSPTGSLQYIKSNWFDDGVNGQWADVEGGLSGIQDANLKQELVNRRPNIAMPEYSPIKGSQSRFSKTGDFTNIYGLHNGSYYSNYGAADAQWDQTKGTWTREGYNYDPNKGWSAVEPVQTWRDTFGAGKAGKFGGKTYDEALALQNEMLNADWFNANLGTTGISGRGDDGMWGATSQKEYARYLAEKQRREEQAAAAAAAEAERQELNNLQASSIRRTASDGMTNEALLAMDAGKAMSTLSRPDYERWMKLNQYQQGRNASLVYNGKRYNDEATYNAAVDAEISRTAPKLDMQNLLNIRGKRKRNAAYAQYQASMDKHVANNPLYSGPKALTQEQLSATSFKNGGKFNYKNYL